MKILITGVFGFVAQNIFLHLKKKYKVVGIGRKNADCKIRNNKQIINQKITKLSLINLNFEPDIIIHCAGSGSVIKSIENKKLDYDKNVVTTKEIAKFIEHLKNKPKVVMFSSAAVYGNYCLKIKKKLKPISPYGKNKLLAEKILQKKSKKSKFQLMILRFYSIYGVGLKKQLIWDACKKINDKENNFFGSGDEIRSWINIKDVVSFIEFLIKKNINKNKILDISSNDIIKNKILLKKLFNLLNFNEYPNFNKLHKKGDPIKQIFNNKKLKNFAWSPKISLFEGLTEYVIWFKKNLKK